MDINIKGISTFFLFSIPAVLALAAIWWLAFGEGLHYFRRELSQEKRSAVIVGAFPLPKAPLKIILDDSRDASVRVDRAEIDGGDLWVYYKNFGIGRVDYIEITWELIAPDGTVVKSDSHFVGSLGNFPESLASGQRAEMHFRIDSDPRATELHLRMSE